MPTRTPNNPVASVEAASAARAGGVEGGNSPSGVLGKLAEVKQQDPIVRLVMMLRAYWKHLLFALGMLVCLVLVNMAVPATIAVLFNEVFPERAWHLLWGLLGAMLLIYFCRNLLYFGTKYTAVYVGEQTAFTLRRQLFDRLQSQSLQFYRQRNPGELTSRVMNDSFAVQTFVQEDSIKIMQAACMFVGLMVVIYVVNWQLALASTIILPVHLYVYFRFRTPIKQSSRHAQQQLANVQGSLIEKFLGMEVVKGFNAEDRENAAFVRAIDRSRASQLVSKKYHVYQKIAADSLVGLGTVALLGFGGYQVMRDSPDAMRPGTFIAFFSYVGMLYPTVIELMSGFAKMTRTVASLDRIYEMLDTSTVEQAEPNPIVKPIHGRLEFRGTTFGHKEDQPLLRDVNLEVPEGKVCAIMGPSGSGKTTLLSLIPRFIDPLEGEILLDGVDVRRYNLRHLRSAIGIAFQEVFLFNTSILENIRYAQPDASMERIERVAHITGAKAFIDRLPRKYHTVIGESGVTLSRGEKQRIVLTRALLKRPRILILDEATASIDFASESRIIPRVIRYMKGRTVLIVTHRADMLRHVDRLVMLDHGRIAYEGPPRRVPTSLADQMGLRPERRAALAGTQAGATAYGTVAGATLSGATAHGTAFGTNFGTTFSTSHGTGHGTAAPGLPHGPAYGPPHGPPAPGAGGTAFGTSTSTGANPALGEQEPQPHSPPRHKNDDDDRDEPLAAGSGTDLPNTLRSIVGALLLATLGLLSGPALADDAAEADDASEAEAAAAEQTSAPAAPARVGSGGVFQPMTGLNDTEMDEVLEVASLQLQTRHGYAPASRDEAALLPAAPRQLRHVETLVREDEGALLLLQIGYRTFRAQPPHVWIYGRRIEGDDEQANDDVDVALELIGEGRAVLDEQYAQISISELESRTISLSYTTPGAALAMLETLGYATVQYTANGQAVGQSRILEANNSVDPENLPIVISMPGPDTTTLVGGEGAIGRGTDFGLGTVPTMATEMSNHTAAAPLMQLMVLYHPAQPEHFAKVRNRIRHEIDRPARQILMEAMVLEISERGLEELGVEWELERAIGNLQMLELGRFPDGLTQAGSTLDVGIDNIFGHFQARIRALISEGHAEILSRPSVLTLDNRQASIRVGEEIPIATSFAGVRAGDTVSFEFKYLPTGILLNVRPRVSSDSDEVSIQVDGIVSAQVPGQDLVMRDDAGRELARAPRVSTRRVQTYLRVPNNSPFIIGGLVARDDTVIEEKVPLLGDIPVLGHLFRNRQEESFRNEVIIVLTPFVLPEDRTVARAQPKDEDAFDSFDNRLFRDAYRIRDEDVFDLGFIYQNQYLQEIRRLAAREIDRDHRLEWDLAFAAFNRGRIPGERMLIYRQIYNIIQRIGIDSDIDVGQMIFFQEADTPAGFSVTFLSNFLREHADVTDEELERMDRGERLQRIIDSLEGQNQALAFTFTEGAAGAMTGALEQPVPEVSVVECNDRNEWGHMLWELNQPDDRGRERRTILLHNRRDFERLRTAIVLEKTIPLNVDAESQALRLEDFAVGRHLLMPTINPDAIHLIDTHTAMYFFATEHYYPAFGEQLTRGIEELREAMRERGVALPEPEQVVPRRPNLPDEDLQNHPDRPQLGF